MGIPGVQVSFVQLDGALRDGQAKTDTSTLPVAIAFNPVKRVKDMAQRLFRHTRSIIAHLNSRRGSIRREPHLNGRLRRRIANGVSDHVLRGTPQKFCIAGYRYWPWRVKN